MTEPTFARPGIDPTFKALLDAFPMTFSAADGVEVARKRLRLLQVPPGNAAGPADRGPEDRSRGAHRHSSADLLAAPEPEEALPVVVFYHGGGFCLGGLDTHDPLARAHAVGAEAIVVAVDYRLAPEHPFPAAVNDSWAALQWVGEHATELGGDPNRIAVAGDSAGGNLAAVMAQLANDNGGPTLSSSCSGTRSPPPTCRCRRSPRTPTRRSWTGT